MPDETYKIASKTWSMTLWTTWPDKKHKKRVEEDMT